MNGIHKTILIDAGNTCLKWAFFDDDVISKQQHLFYSKQTAIQKFQNLVQKHNEVSNTIIMVSVLGDKFNREASAIAEQHTLPIKQIKSVRLLAGLTNAYDQPHKLGADRFVAMIAAYHLSNKEKNNNNACIIIDTGTATTIDAVDEQGIHLGGLILPGLDLFSQSLLNNTQQLSLWGKLEKHSIQKDTKYSFFSTNTTDAINSASIYGLSGAIDHITTKMEHSIKQGHEVHVNRFLCGGSAKALLPYLDSKYILQKDLIMQGLKIASGYK